VSVHSSQGVTVDRAYVLIHDRMSDRRVVLRSGKPRARGNQDLLTDEQKTELEQTMKSSHQSEFSADYSVVESKEIVNADSKVVEVIQTQGYYQDKVLEEEMEF